MRWHGATARRIAAILAYVPAGVLAGILAGTCAGTLAGQSQRVERQSLSEVFDLLVRSRGLSSALQGVVIQSRKPGLDPKARRELLDLALERALEGNALRMTRTILRELPATSDTWARSLHAIRTQGAARPLALALLTLEHAQRAARAAKPDAMLGAWRAAVADAKKVGDPRLLHAVHERRKALEVTQRAWAALGANPKSGDAMGRFLCFIAGEWARGLPMLTENGPAERNILRNKLGLGSDALHAQRCISIADSWLTRARGASQEESTLQRDNLIRHGLAWYYRAWPLAKDPAEQHRIVRMMSRLEAKILKPDGPNTWRFATDDMDRVRTANGVWRVIGGALRGRNTGPSTWSTFRYAFENTKSVTIRGGIHSPAGLNFRVQAGEFNAIFNWEVRPENHFWFHQAERHTKPRLYQAGKEHVLTLRQIGKEVVVFLDGKFVIRGEANLSGTVAVYPALGSEIFVKEVLVDGEIDPFLAVTAPIGRRM